MTFDDKSVIINPNVPVTFETIKYIKGKNSFGNWHCLDIYFKDEQNRYLVSKFYQPKEVSSVAVMLDKIEYAQKLREILDTLSQKSIWNTIPIGTWEDFYTIYINHMKPLKGKKCFIKTVPVKHWKEDFLMTAGLADKNFISLFQDLEYTVLEESSAQDYQEEIIEIEDKLF